MQSFKFTEYEFEYTCTLSNDLLTIVAQHFKERSCNHASIDKLIFEDAEGNKITISACQAYKMLDLFRTGCLSDAIIINFQMEYNKNTPIYIELKMRIPDIEFNIYKSIELKPVIMDDMKLHKLRIERLENKIDDLNSKIAKDRELNASIAKNNEILTIKLNEVIEKLNNIKQ